MNFFKYESLKKFLTEAKTIAPITTMENWDYGKAIILRHDVDFEIKPAYRLSSIENECGVTSTFYVMVTNQFYNPISPPNREMLLEMIGNGFEIGLHFDPACYGNISGEVLQSKVDSEIRILEFAINHEIKSISLHKPARYGKHIAFTGYNNAYFPSHSYMSDTHMVLEKNPFEFIRGAKERAIELTLHPFHYTEKGDNYLTIFTRFIHNMTDMVDSEFRGFETYRALIGNRKLTEHINGRKEV